LRGVDVVGISRPVARRAALIRLDLRQRRRAITHRAMDLLIAATALERGLILVTRNTTDYADIPGLQTYQQP
jgi:predicted nucleic acid-binding protein